MAGGPLLTTQIPSAVLAGGTTTNSTGLLEGHIFQQGIEKPDVLSTVITKFPQYYLLSLTEKIGASEMVANSTRSWSVMGRTRRGATVASIANGTTATVSMTLDTTAVSADNNLGYFLVGDTIRVAESEEIGRVTATAIAGGVQVIDVVRYGGGNWSTSLILGTWHIGHVGSMYGEGSTGAGGYRAYFPDNDWNATTILRRDFKITRDAMTAKKWINAPDGSKDWYFAQEDFEHKEFLRDIEATLLCGKRFKATSLQGANLSRGLFEYATGSGVTQTFSSSTGIQEADWANFLTQLSDQQGGNDLIALCGTQLLADTQFALREYRTQPNGSDFATKAGLDFQTYQFLGKRIHLAKYEMFSDTSIFPAVTASSSVKDPRNLALVLDFASTENGANIQVHYREGAKMIQKMIPGMPSPGATAASKFDGIEGALLSEFMPVCFLPNRLGLVYANS